MIFSLVPVSEDYRVLAVLCCAGVCVSDQVVLPANHGEQAPDDDGEGDNSNPAVAMPDIIFSCPVS